MTTLSPADYELLLIRSGEISKFSKRDLAELYDEMKAAHAFMLAERKRGVVGRIEFTLFGNEVAA